MKNEELRGAQWWVWFVTMLLLCVLMVCSLGCTKRIYVPVESVSQQRDTIMLTLQRTDTVLNSDTVRIREKGDSVIMEIIKWRTRIHESHDTVYKSKIDTVYQSKPYPVETVKEIPRQRSWWESALLWIGGISLTVLILFSIWRIRKKFTKCKTS